MRPYSSFIVSGKICHSLWSDVDDDDVAELTACELWTCSEVRASSSDPRTVERPCQRRPHHGIPRQIWQLCTTWVCHTVRFFHCAVYNFSIKKTVNF